MMFHKSQKFLANPKKFLKGLVRHVGYDTCHQTKGYDARKCRNDCNELRKKKFAKDCKKNNGVFKCCIR